MADTAVLDAQTPTVEGRARPGDAALAARLDALDLPQGGFTAAARADAAARLQATGLPGARDEYWRYTDPAPFNAVSPAALPVPALDLAALGSLTFTAPDEARWPALRLARQVIRAGGAAGAVLNAAKEQALDDFIAGRIGFMDMAPAVERALDACAREPGFASSPGDLATVLEWDAQARRLAACTAGAA